MCKFKCVITVFVVVVVLLKWSLKRWASEKSKRKRMRMRILVLLVLHCTGTACAFYIEFWCSRVQTIIITELENKSLKGDAFRDFELSCTLKGRCNRKRGMSKPYNNNSSSSMREKKRANENITEFSSIIHMCQDSASNFDIHFQIHNTHMTQCCARRLF